MNQTLRLSINVAATFTLTAMLAFSVEPVRFRQALDAAIAKADRDPPGNRLRRRS